MGNKQSELSSTTAASDMPDPTTVKIKQAYKQLAGISDELPKQNFIDLFKPFESLAELLYAFENEDKSACMTEERFKSLATAAVTTVEATAQFEFCTSLYTRGNTRIEKTDCINLLHTLCNTSWAYAGVDLCTQAPASEAAILALTFGVFGQDEDVPTTTFISYISKHCPVIANGLFHFMNDAFLQENPLNTQGAAICPEHSQLGRLILERECLLTEAAAWLVSSTLPLSYFPRVAPPSLPLVSMTTTGGWYPLYTSNSHGLSVNRFRHHVFEYKGSSVMFVKFGDNCFCFANDGEWREDVQQYGGSEMMLVQVTPTYKILADGGPMLYLNLTNRTAPRCLRIGKRTAILEIDNEFDKVKFYGIEYSLHSIEIWGCAGATALQKQQEQKEWERKEINKHKDRKLKIDKDEWKDSPDRQILELGGVQTEHAER